MTIAPFLFYIAKSNLLDEKSLQTLNIISSIGSGGVVSFLFYFFVNRRLEKKWNAVVRTGAQKIYLDAKRDIAFAIVHASIKGGRTDISADTGTIDFLLSGGANFKKVFPWRGEAWEGFYAFQNQMSGRTPEYREIIFNLKSISRGLNRIIDSGSAKNHAVYQYVISLDEMIYRIEDDGAGYDESRGLCGFIWEMFSMESDSIEKIISKL